MKTKFSLKILFVLFCLLIPVTFTQEKPTAVKVAEYNDETANLQLLAEATNNFAARLAAEPQTTKGLIAFYRGSSYLSRYQQRYDVLSEYLQNFREQNINSIKERTAFEWGGRSLNRSLFVRVEFWIVPQDAEKPDTRARECALCVCPTFEVEASRVFKNSSKLQYFVLNASGVAGDDVEYHWTVSAGKIIEGQGTPTIKVDAGDAAEVTATVTIDGVCPECVHEVSFTAKIQ